MRPRVSFTGVNLPSLASVWVNLWCVVPLDVMIISSTISFLLLEVLHSRKGGRGGGEG